MEGVGASRSTLRAVMSDATPGTVAYRDLVESLEDFVVGFDEGGTLRYVNTKGAEVLGYRSDDLLGRNIGEFVHPDDVERALEVVGMILSDTDGSIPVSPALYRIRTASGAYLPLEFYSPPAGSSALAPIVTVGRWSGDQPLHRQVLETLTSGAPIAEAFALVPEFARWRNPTERYAVVVEERDGGRSVFGDELPDLLSGVASSDDPDDGDPGDGDPDDPGPAEVARRSGEEVIVPHDDLPPAVRAAADEVGLAGCWAVPVADPLGVGPALLVAWSSAGGPPVPVHRYALVLMEQVLTLVLQWRAQLDDLWRAANEDALTGVANRARFFTELRQAPSVGGPEPTAVLYVDLDGFKPVNDRHGHAAGDAVLVEVARRIGAVVRPTDLVARLGGDEFAVLCAGVAGVDEATAIAERIVAVVAEPMVVAGARIAVGASVGVAVTDSPPGDALLDAADQALYDAKAAGKGAWRMADIG